jgi:hypothetical protein
MRINHKLLNWHLQINEVHEVDSKMFRFEVFQV